MTRLFIISLGLLGLSGCGSSELPDEALVADGSTGAPVTPITPVPITSGQGNASAAFSGIAASETVRFTGTEPFWGGQVAGYALTYSTPELPDGADIAVDRFAGKGGVSWSGTYSGRRFVLAVTPGRCSDGMSDRIYPFVATLEVAGEQRSGCAWSDRSPFTGPDSP